MFHKNIHCQNLTIKYLTANCGLPILREPLCKATGHNLPQRLLFHRKPGDIISEAARVRNMSSVSVSSATSSESSKPCSPMGTGALINKEVCKTFIKFWKQQILSLIANIIQISCPYYFIIHSIWKNTALWKLWETEIFWGYSNL